MITEFQKQQLVVHVVESYIAMKRIVKKKLKLAQQAYNLEPTEHHRFMVDFIEKELDQLHNNHLKQIEEIKSFK